MTADRDLEDPEPVVERRVNRRELKAGIDRRRQDEDYAERMIGGARLDRSRPPPHEDEPARPHPDAEPTRSPRS